MRRVLPLLVGTVVLVALVALLTTSDTKDKNPHYVAELDTAFGLTGGGDLKVAGVRAGKITKLKLDRATNRALVSFDVTRNGFGSLRTDATCATRPQSLIGEYYLDCQPGTAPQPLGQGGRIPIAQTSTTVAPDLVNTILRKPYAERLSIILNELGAAVAGNEENIGDAVRRASPALQQTDKLLAILGKQNETLKSLVSNADVVVGDLAASRQDIGRWVDQAGRTAAITATRKQALAEGFRRLPAFLEQLAPTMRLLGASSEAQTPALQNLGAAAPQLKTLFERLGPFSQASRPAIKALGKASVVGTTAVKAANPVVAQLRQSFSGAPEATNNLAIILDHLADPSFAVESDPRAAAQTGRPAPTGYSGFEAILQYFYDQALSTNVYDSNTHALKISVIPNGNCTDYADLADAKANGEECASGLGPNQPGINFPDKTATDDGTTPTVASRKTRAPTARTGAPAAPGAPAGSGDGGGSGGSSTSGGGSPSASGTQITPPVTVAPGVTVPAVTAAPAPTAPALPSTPDLPGVGRVGTGTGAGARGAGKPDSARELLDYLLGK